MKSFSKRFILILVMAVIFAPLAHGATKNPYLKPNESWISISGTAIEAGPDAFILDYGEGTILVEMDDWDWYKEGRKILEGDKVTVYGEIDDDLYETTKIEASSVYVENLGTYFYANSADEEYDNDYDYWVVAEPIVLGKTVVRGLVSSVSGREFTIDTGSRKLTVDTSKMPFNPLDNKGFLKIDKADYVSVSGDMNKNFWSGRELMANSIVILDDD